MKDEITYKIKQIVGQIFSLDGASEDSVVSANAEALLERYRLTDLMSYRAFDEENGLVLMDNGDKPAMGFAFAINPAIIAGEDMENVMEALVSRCPRDTIIQSCLHSTPDVYRSLQNWLDKREQHTEKYPLLREMARRRARFLDECSTDRSLLPSTRVHTRYVHGYIFFRIPFRGDIRNATDVDRWIRQGIELQNALLGILTGGRLCPALLNEQEHKRVLTQLLNPNFTPQSLDEGSGGYTHFPNNLIRKETRIALDKEGGVNFQGGDSDRTAVVVTVDSYPEELTIQHTRMLTGDIMNRDDRIPDPFWLFTTIHVMDPDDARTKMLSKLGLINRQTLSDSAFFRSMASTLFKRRDETGALLDVTENRHQIVRMMTGIIVYSDPEGAREVGEAIASTWRKAGFQASPEKYIALPMFLASLPYGYTPEMDKGESGLCRLQYVNSFNAACAMPIAADWRGHALACGGPTFTTRRGQLASLDLMREETNYNMSVVAASGSGKSFFSAELVCDYLSRGGIVRVIDVGRSYQRLASILDGQVLEFKPQSPKSINPFWGVTEAKEANENIPMWRDTIELMAFPRGQADSWTYGLIEQTITQAWNTHGEKMGVKEIWDLLMQSDDQRLLNLADQLKTYAVGRLSPWFNGEPQINFRADFSILELEELNADKHLRTVVLALVINMIVRDMYRFEKDGAPLVPKLLLIDEAWDLMGKNSGSSGNFIEEAARRIRKYRGSLLTVTQSYADYFQSDGAKAALTNSSWRCSLAQSGQSIRTAEAEKVIPGGDFVWDLLSTVKRGAGFSELHICDSTGTGEVFRLIIDPFSYYTFTTNPDDKNAIAELVQSGMSILEAISELADRMEKRNLEQMRRR